jgi:hypothetical protein
VAYVRQMRSGSRRLEDGELLPADAPPAVSEPEPALLSLQRGAGNAAVTRMLARDVSFNPIRPEARPNPLDPTAAAQAVLADHDAATQAVRDWFDAFSQPHRESGNVPGSIPELVAQACALPVTLKDGTKATVRDKGPPPVVEEHLRARARTLGLRLTEHRDASDVAGVRSELDAVLANLGAIPTSLTLGDDDAKVTASLSGKITGEAKIGGAKVEVEGSSEGVEGSVSTPGGGGKVTGKVGPEGGGGSVTVPGAKFGLEVGGKGIKAEVKAGELLTVNGSLTREADNVIAWKAEVSIGTIGKLIMPEDVAKVLKGTQDTFSKSAGELIHNLDDPVKVKEHGGALAGAVSDALEKAKKSATQKPGWRVGAELKGDSAGGLSGSVTFTWVF